MEKLSALTGSMQTGAYCPTGATHSAPGSNSPRFCHLSSSLPGSFGSLQSAKLSLQKLLKAEQRPSRCLSTRPRGSVAVEAVRVSRGSGTGFEEKALRPGLATMPKRTSKARKKEDASSEIDEFQNAVPRPMKMATFRVAEAAEVPDQGAQQTVDYYSTHMEQLLGRGKKHGRPKAAASPSKKAAGKSRTRDVEQLDIDEPKISGVSDTERLDRVMQNGRRVAGKNGCLRLHGDDGCLRAKSDDGWSKQGGVAGSGPGSTTTWPLDVLESRNERVMMEVKGEILESLNTWKKNRRRPKEVEARETRGAEASRSSSSGGTDARPPGRRKARVEISGSPFLSETPGSQSFLTESGESEGASSVDADRSGPSESADAKLPPKSPRRSGRNARAMVETSPLSVWEEELKTLDPEGASSAEASGSSSQTADIERPLANSTNRGRPKATSAVPTEVSEGKWRAEECVGASSAEAERPEAGRASEKGAGPSHEADAQKRVEGGKGPSAQKGPRKKSEAASSMTLLYVEDGNEKVGSGRRGILKEQGRESPQTESGEASDSGAEPSESAQSASQSRETSARTRNGHSKGLENAELEQETMKEGGRDDGREKSRTRGSDALEGKGVRALAHKSSGTKGQASKVKPTRRKTRRLEVCSSLTAGVLASGRLCDGLTLIANQLENTFWLMVLTWSSRL
jgi:hypothetical protein